MVEEKYKELHELSEELARCGRCGFCQEVCPVYQVSADECGVARGRNVYARELVEGRLEHLRRNDAFFSECLLCRACVDACFSSVKTDEIVIAGRKCLRRARGISPAHKFVFERLLLDHRSMAKSMRVLKAAHRAVPAPVLSGLRIFGWLGGSLDHAERIADMIPREFLRERLSQRRLRGAGTARATYFIGCGVNFMFPDAGEATVDILQAMGYEVSVVDHGCCGMPAYSHGDIRSAKRLAMHNIEALSEAPDSLIVTDCSSCASCLKNYPKLLASDDSSDTAESSKAQQFAGRVRDITEILAGTEFNDLLRQNGGARPESGNTITFHEPCHLGRYQGLGSEARDALQSLVGSDYVEMKEASWCCGAAGSFAVEHPDLSKAILDRKVRNIQTTDADIVATTCPSCMMQMRVGTDSANLEIRVMHLAEVARDRILKA
jgi:glycolate oxidase iron-sulfur subunit